MDNNQMDFLSFGKANLPKPYESKETTDNKYVTYGEGKYYNTYPNYLLYLYNNSPIHSSIINTKTNFIIGAGLSYADGKELDVKLNASDSLKEFVDKVVKDFLLFNYFCVEAVYNVFGEVIEYHHVPAQTVRVNNSKTKFWYNEDWAQSRKVIQYDRFNLRKVDGSTQLFFYDGYVPSENNVYAQPEYMAGAKAIETDIAIREFSLNQIKNHFSPSTYIGWYRGDNVSNETKKEIRRGIEEKYTGDSGSKIIFDWLGREGKAAEIKNLSAGDWDKQYIEVAKNAADNIYQAHEVTSPALIGVKQEGQLGSTQELESAYEIWNNKYIRVKRAVIESALNQLFQGSKLVTGKVSFKDKPLFSPKVESALKEKIMTINELRAEAGLPTIEGGDRFIGQAAPAQPNVGAPVQQDSIDPEVDQEMEADDVKKKSSSEPTFRKLTEEDFEQVKDLGYHSDEYELLGSFDLFHSLKFDMEQDVADYVIKNDINHLTLKELSALLKEDVNVKVAPNALQGILEKLHQAGVVKVDYKDGKVNVMPSKVADVSDTDRVLVMYQYIKRPEVEGPELLSTSRSFCKKIIQNNKFYSRQDIQQMSSLFGFDVFQYTGGFYYNPDTDTTTPYCRHQWKAVRVKRKK